MFRLHVDLGQRPLCGNVPRVSRNSNSKEAGLPERAKTRVSGERRGEKTGQMMQDPSGHCRDFDFYTGRNRELLKNYPKRNGGGSY